MQIRINVPTSPSQNRLDKTTKENVIPTSSKQLTNIIDAERPEFDGGCWEMLNQDAIQILPPRPKIPTRPTTSCIKPTFKEKEKKGNGLLHTPLYYFHFDYSTEGGNFLAICGNFGSTGQVGGGG